MEIKNAVIKRTTLGIEDHGFLTAFLQLDYGDTSQGFGGYALDGSAGVFIRRVLEVVGVTEWDMLSGKTIRVRTDLNRIEAIGHIVKDSWFYPAVELT